MMSSLAMHNFRAVSIFCQSKYAMGMIREYEDGVAAEAARLGMDGVICGHIHHPVMRTMGAVTYMNDGDWVDRLAGNSLHLGV
jgi:UDP-2,3-diacylglucosamine pyrophosphatase LpxH